jgi:hypothetical protein
VADLGRKSCRPPDPGPDLSQCGHQDGAQDPLEEVELSAEFRHADIDGVNLGSEGVLDPVEVDADIPEVGTHLGQVLIEGFGRRAWHGYALLVVDGWRATK